jgi:hypothetical protein
MPTTATLPARPLSSDLELYIIYIIGRFALSAGLVQLLLHNTANVR